jgi:hypothetical protein
MQEAFLKERPPVQPPVTVDTVVQFLRQRGDVVFRTGEGFSLNSCAVLNAAELVDRANRKKAELGQTPFPQLGGEPPVAPVARAAEAQSAGD